MSQPISIQGREPGTLSSSSGSTQLYFVSSSPSSSSSSSSSSSTKMLSTSPQERGGRENLNSSHSLMNGSKPSGGEKKSFRVVDLVEDFDDTLLNTFYTELMIKNFPLEDELEPLPAWRERCLDKNKSTAADGTPDFHIVLLLDDVEPLAENIQERNARATIAGAVVVEYYEQVNCGLLTYILVNSKYRGKGLGRILAEKACFTVEENARGKGHLAGCNAIFLETNSAERVDPTEDVMPPAQRHEILYKIGLRLLNFDYVQVALDASKNKVNYLLLTVFISPKIPKIEMEDEVRYYLPSSLVKNVIRAFWSASHLSKFYEDVDYKRMMDQLGRREKIFLLDLPWERPFTIVDMKEQLDLELLVGFYQDMVIGNNTSRIDEIDTLESWLNRLSKYTDTKDDFHLVLALKYSQDAHEHSKPIVVGGLVFEYYHSENCGLLTYLQVPHGERGQRMAQALIDYAIETLDMDARLHGNLAGCNVLFMEIPNYNTEGTDFNEVSEASNNNLQKQVTEGGGDVTEMYGMLDKMGWKLVDFDYVKPPVGEELKKCKTLFLTVLTDRIPKLYLDEEKHYQFLPRPTLQNFLEGMWASSCATSGFRYEDDLDYKRMMEQVIRWEKIPLLGRPWSRPWTLLDMRERLDVDLLISFYRELIEPNLLDKNGLESLEDWLKMLSPEAKQTAKEDFHVLLALKSYASGQQHILGGIAFKYFISTNCGFLTYLVVKKTHDQQTEAVARALVHRAVDILEHDAISRGHLSGCNVIFLETVATLKGGAEAGVKTDDIIQQHALLEKMGWRLLDLDYASPPIAADLKKRKAVLLTVFITPRIPKYIHSERFGYCYYYLPVNVVKKFVKEYWKGRCRRIGYDYSQDIDYRRMTAMMQRRQRVPLLELPWERSGTLLDLRENYDVSLLYTFYQNFLVPAFPDKTAREPLGTWIQMLSYVEGNERRETNMTAIFHVLLSLSYPEDNSTKPTILGGLTFEYLPSTNCGLLTYLVLPPRQNPEVMTALIEEAVEILENDAISSGHIAGCNAIFMDASIAKPQSETSATVDWTTRHDALHRLGWKLVGFHFFEPPLSRDIGNRSVDHLYASQHLLVLVTPKIPRFEEDDDEAPSRLSKQTTSSSSSRSNSSSSSGSVNRARSTSTNSSNVSSSPSSSIISSSTTPRVEEALYIPVELLRSFLGVYWGSTYERIGMSLSKDRQYQRMMRQFENRRKIPLLDYPWDLSSLPLLGEL